MASSLGSPVFPIIYLFNFFSSTPFLPAFATLSPLSTAILSDRGEVGDSLFDYSVNP